MNFFDNVENSIEIMDMADGSYSYYTCESIIGVRCVIEDLEDGSDLQQVVCSVIFRLGNIVTQYGAPVSIEEAKIRCERFRDSLRAAIAGNIHNLVIMI